MKRPSQRRFTMLELLTVMTILFILLGMTFGLMPMITKSSKDAKTRASIKKIEIALERFSQAWGYYPQAPSNTLLSKTWFESIVDKNGKAMLNTGDLDWASGPATYTDAYSEAFYYQCPGSMNPEKFDLWSRGKDGLFGGADSSTPAASQKNDADTINCDDLSNWRD
jgi:type II secretory pathway pseudopilin PulG